mmetsp:Transcript_21343/g.42391  ORF Transcript_21343/g.42391 Transcript_21343/m.42391 type:complete len:313 (-) Transcript_21343:239-1177(-)
MNCAVPQRSLVRKDNQAPSCPGQHYVHPPVVCQESESPLSVSSDCREQHNVLLLPLESVNCADLQSLERNSPDPPSLLLPLEILYHSLQPLSLGLVGCDDPDLRGRSAACHDRKKCGDNQLSLRFIRKRAPRLQFHSFCDIHEIHPAVPTFIVALPGESIHGGTVLGSDPIRQFVLVEVAIRESEQGRVHSALDVQKHGFARLCLHQSLEQRHAQSGLLRLPRQDRGRQLLLVTDEDQPGGTLAEGDKGADLRHLAALIDQEAVEGSPPHSPVGHVCAGGDDHVSRSIVVWVRRFLSSPLSFLLCHGHVYSV